MTADEGRPTGERGAANKLDVAKGRVAFSIAEVADSLHRTGGGVGASGGGLLHDGELETACRQVACPWCGAEPHRGCRVRSSGRRDLSPRLELRPSRSHPSREEAAR